MAQVPAGWYPDPEAPTGHTPLLRWWDGYRWTDHRQPQTGPPRPTGPTTPDGQPLAGWWWRVLAYLLDALIVGLVTYVVTWPAQMDIRQDIANLGLEYQQRFGSGDASAFDDYMRDVFDVAYADHFLSTVLVPTLIVLAYHVVLLRSRGATLGKAICGMRVRLRETDGRLSWQTIGTRIAVQFGPGWLVGMLIGLSASLWMVLLVIVGVIVFGVVDPLAALGNRRQTIHDRAAATVVVRIR